MSATSTSMCNGRCWGSLDWAVITEEQQGGELQQPVCRCGLLLGLCSAVQAAGLGSSAAFAEVPPSARYHGPCCVQLHCHMASSAHDTCSSATASMAAMYSFHPAQAACCGCRPAAAARVSDQQLRPLCTYALPLHKCHPCMFGPSKYQLPAAARRACLPLTCDLAVCRAVAGAASRACVQR